MWFLEIAALPTEELAISQILQLEQHSPQVAEDIILASSHLEKGQLWYQAETGQLPRQGETTSNSKQVGRRLRSGPRAALWNGRAPLPFPLPPLPAHCTPKK